MCIIEFSSYCIYDFTIHAGPVDVSVGRFWSMVWEYGLHTIVMLTRCVEAGKVYMYIQLQYSTVNVASTFITYESYLFVRSSVFVIGQKSCMTVLLWMRSFL